MEARRIRTPGLGIFASVLFSAVSLAAGPYQLYTVVPCRLVDTRDPAGMHGGGPSLTHGATRSFAVLGDNSRPCGLPADGSVKAVVVNPVIVAPTAFGHFTMWAYQAAIPATSNLNFNAGESAIANGAIVPIGSLVTPYQISVYVALGDTTGHADFILDITGYYK